MLVILRAMLCSATLGSIHCGGERDWYVCCSRNGSHYFSELFGLALWIQDLPHAWLLHGGGWFCGQGLCSGRRPVCYRPVLGNRLALGRTGGRFIVSGARSTFTDGRPPAPGGRHQSACFQYAGRPANSKIRCRGRYRLARLLQRPQLLETLAEKQEIRFFWIKMDCMIALFLGI